MKLQCGSCIDCSNFKNFNEGLLESRPKISRGSNSEMRLMLEFRLVIVIISNSGMSLMHQLIFLIVIIVVVTRFCHLAYFLGLDSLFARHHNVSISHYSFYAWFSTFKLKVYPLLLERHDSRTYLPNHSVQNRSMWHDKNYWTPPFKADFICIQC